MEMPNVNNHGENSLVVSSKTKRTLSRGPAIPLDSYSGQMTCVSTQRLLQEVTALFIHNSQKVETAQLHVTRPMCERIVLYPYKGKRCSATGYLFLGRGVMAMF